MTDTRIRLGVLITSTLAVFAVLFEAPTIVRVPVVLCFALVAPGLALSRFVPTLYGVDRIGAAVAISLALNVVASLLLVALGRWSGAPVLVLLALIALVLSMLPLQSPWRRRQQGRERLRNEQIRDRRLAQRQAYAQVQSLTVSDRRQGLVALSWLLEEDGRRPEAARLRELARSANPPRLRLDGDVIDEAEVHLVHQHARSEDPEVRRQGLFEVAELLDNSGRGDEAQTLRAIANDPDPPPAPNR